VQLVDWVAAQLGRYELFYGHGTDNATDEAVVLVFHALGLSFDDPEELLHETASPGAKEKLLDMLSMRIEQRCPAPYITGEAWFAGYRFQVDRRVLIPRSPLAEWIEERFSPWVSPSAVRRILDVGTGSGCIAIALAHAFPDAQVVGVDLLPDTLELARCNVEHHGLGGRLELLRSDLYDSVTGRFELIVSNPPYVDRQALDDMPPEYRHEPREALAGGHDGLDFVHRILNESRAHLSDNGALVVEVGASDEAFNRAYPELPVVWLELAHGGEGVFLIEAKDLII
jgi:ribosomal protein L3 glutamine methyltransferase